MSMSELDNVQAEEYSLLRKMIQEETPESCPVDLSALRKVIEAVWEDMKDCAPPDFSSLYADFLAEYDKFKDFLLYEPLIGKNIVALGGGFSSGKSSFLNAMMAQVSHSRRSILPEDIDPSTSVPTYLVNGEGNRLSGVNIFDCRFEMRPKDIRKISHGFGASEGEDGLKLGHIVRNLFLETKYQKYEHIAFLDTPGYSKPDAESYSAKTDEQIARRQLNTADYILWFVPAEHGTIRNEDVAFLQSLQTDVPKLIILSKADKATEDNLAATKAHISDVLRIKNISFDGVCIFSAEDPELSELDLLESCLTKLDHKCEDNQFAVNFKRLFLHMRDYYQEELADEKEHKAALNQALTLLQDGALTGRIRSLLERVNVEIKRLENHAKELGELQYDFFRELKFAGDQVGISLPEPSEVELLGDETRDPLSVLSQYLEHKGKKPDPQAAEILQQTLSGVELSINRDIGAERYREQLRQTLEALSQEAGPFCMNTKTGAYRQQDALRKAVSKLSPEEGADKKTGNYRQQDALREVVSTLSPEKGLDGKTGNYYQQDTLRHVIEALGNIDAIK